jgi:hypothetical protein
MPWGEPVDAHGARWRSIRRKSSLHTKVGRISVRPSEESFVQIFIRTRVVEVPCIHPTQATKLSLQVPFIGKGIGKTVPTGIAQIRGSFLMADITATFRKV